METIATQDAFAKLTRTLRITGVRADGYHLLESEMVTVDFSDTLKFSPGTGLTIDDAIAWTSADSDKRGGFAVPADDTNLVARALVLAGSDLAVHLTKRIPAGAGLGGGSADAAAVLRQLDYKDLEQASRLGADVPFCLAGGRAIVRGVGEVLEPLDYCELDFVIVTPDFGLSTAAVYAAYDRLGAMEDRAGKNDLTSAALSVEPRLSFWRDLLGDTTGIEPVLAGSGSSFFVECGSNESTRLGALVRERVKRSGVRAVVTPTTTVRSTSASN